ncbi:MAG: hypothetical protein FJX89_03915 [Bacteroidetes bacterium]|nr:hypothetical protein [Bacteroidota bacterium]
MVPGQVREDFRKALVAGATYSHHLLRCAMLPYAQISHPSPLYKGRLCQVDPIYGYTLLPFAQTYHMAPPAEPVPGFTDRHGFRVLQEHVQLSFDTGKLDILFLGCSFTYGSLCQPDSIFAQLSSKVLGFRYLNAGVGG